MRHWSTEHVAALACTLLAAALACVAVRGGDRVARPCGAAWVP